MKDIKISGEKKFQWYWRWRRILYSKRIHHQTIYLMHHLGLSLAHDVVGVVSSLAFKDPITELPFRRLFP